MKKRNTARAVAVAAALAGLAWPAAQALAQTAAYTSTPVDLFAGPSGDYPVVSEIDAGVPVTVMGCLSDYSWCDVAMPGLRGWIYAGYLSYPYQGQYVPLEGYGAVIGLPIIGFSIGTYWDSFYRHRPWYGDRDHWAHMPPHGYGDRPPGPGPGPRPREEGRPQEPRHSYAPPNAGRPEQPPMGGRPGPEPRFQGNPGGPRPDGGMHEPRQPGGNFGQPRPMQQEAAPRPQAPQPGGFRPGAPAGGFEHGAPPMRAPAPEHAAPQQGGHPSGEGGGHREGRQPGQ